MLRLITTLLVVLCALSAASARPADEAPPWLQQAAASSIPTYDKDVPAVVLKNERTVTVSDDGRIVSVVNWAVKILNREGRIFADATELYLSEYGKVREMNAWLIRPNGFVRKFGKDETIDRIVDPNDIYNEYRLRTIDATSWRTQALFLVIKRRSKSGHSLTRTFGTPNHACLSCYHDTH